MSLTSNKIQKILIKDFVFIVANLKILATIIYFYKEHTIWMEKINLFMK